MERARPEDGHGRRSRMGDPMRDRVKDRAERVAGAGGPSLGGFGRGAAETLQSRFLAALELGAARPGDAAGSSAAGTAAADGDAGDEAADSVEAPAPEGEIPPQPESAQIQTLGDVTTADLDDVRRCLDEIIASASPAVPMYAELATFQGEPAIVYALATEDPESGTLSRIEIWVAGRDDCQVRYFTQLDR